MAMVLVDAAVTTVSGSSFSYSAAADAVETMDVATVLADAAAVEMIVAAANTEYLQPHIVMAYPKPCDRGYLICCQQKRFCWHFITLSSYTVI